MAIKQTTKKIANFDLKRRESERKEREKEHWFESGVHIEAVKTNSRVILTSQVLSIIS